jgi:hypothetical protein
MKRQLLLHLCCGLLIWAVFDDIVASQTPDPDDDVAAAADNDCLQWVPLSLQFRADSQSEMVSPACSDGAAPGTRIVRTLSTLPASHHLSNPLYLLMSLQR